MMCSRLVDLLFLYQTLVTWSMLRVGWAHSVNADVYRNVTLSVGPFEVLLLVPSNGRADRRSASPKYVPPKLSVFDTLTNSTLWSSADGEPFLLAAHGDVTVKQNSGYFTVEDKVKDTCRSLVVTSWSGGDVIERSDRSSITPKAGERKGMPAGERDERGRVGSGAAVLKATLCGSLEVQVTFQAVTVGGHPQLIVSMALVGDTHGYDQLFLVYSKDIGEQFFGFGHQYTQFNLNGRSFPVFSTEQGIGRGRQPLTTALNKLDPGSGGHWYTTYTHIPFYTTSGQKAFFLESPEYVLFDLSDNRTVSIQLLATNITFRLFAGCGSVRDLLTSYTAYTGRMAAGVVEERTTQGAVLGLEGGTEAVRLRTDKICDMASVMWPNSSCPVTGLWLQDWTGEREFTLAGKLQRVGLWWVWELDESHYPGFSEFVQSMRDRGISTLIYFNPMITNITKRGTPYRKNFFEEGVEKGYFVTDKDDKLWLGYSEAALVDLTNPAAAQWMEDIIASVLLDTGALGHMNDFGEALPLDGHLYHGDGFQLHNQYPTMWAKLNKNATERCRQKTGDEYVYFMRSSGAFTQSYTTHYWMGDQLVTWDDYDGMQSAIVGMLSAGMSGHSLVHTDIGGYADVEIATVKFIRTKLLLQRWCELAVFSSMFRSHLGTLPDTSWQIDSDAETLRSFLSMARLYESLMLYREDLRMDARERGWPMVRAMVFEFWDNTAVYDLDLRYEQFMFGSSILYAPVTSSHNNGSVDVWLPAGTRWTYAWDFRQVFDGNNTFISLPAPLGQPAFLLRQPLPEKDWVRALHVGLAALGAILPPHRRYQ